MGESVVSIQTDETQFYAFTINSTELNVSTSYTRGIFLDHRCVVIISVLASSAEGCGFHSQLGQNIKIKE